MASVFWHAVAALSIGTCFYRPQIPKRVWIVGAVCSVVPDLDVVGFRFGIRYGDFWGHRGFTHSLVFAAVLSGMVAFVVLRQEYPGLGDLPYSLICFLRRPATAFSTPLRTAVWESHSFLLSTITAISCLGDQFLFHQ
jgi:membrane-bound metal-dependent hydrolase YbcI (DUF457 family)